MATTIRLRNPKQLGPAIRRLAKAMDRSTVTALRKTARWGATQSRRVSASTKPRPRATGTYARSFVVTRIPDGALLSNSAGHAIFVEVGRRKGKRPPVAAIERWVLAKKLARRPARVRALAFVIARKIGRRGFKGRYVMRKLAQAMEKRLPVEIEAQYRRAFERQRAR